MSEPSERPEPRRILVALEGEDTGAVMEAAAGLAAAMRAELVGLFVEDTELLEAANLPITATVPRHASGGARLDAAMMRRALRISALQASRRLAVVAERRQVRWSFRVIRGPVGEQVLAEARSHDLLALAGAGRAPPGARRRSAAHALAEKAPCSVLLLHGAIQAGRPVLVLYDGSRRALALGRDLARMDARPLLVIALGDGAEAAERHRAEAAAWLGAEHVKAELVARAVAEADELCALVRGEYPAVLVLDREGPLAARFGFDALLRGLGCALVALR